MTSISSSTRHPHRPPSSKSLTPTLKHERDSKLQELRLYRCQISDTALSGRRTGS
ncbi:hypothetical protein J6590_106472 [Homalodisca vitripennis]|nr:hypothetical protein J6590_106472 [Homalodisca vitripennis]